MAGDFNCTLINNNFIESHKLSANLLCDLVKELCIKKCYNHLNPDARLYTWPDIRSFARLDRKYISALLKSHIQCIFVRRARFQITTV